MLKKTLPGTWPTTVMLIVFSKYSFKNRNKIRNEKKKKKSIGVKFMGALIADNVYRATFKKSLENEK